MRRFFKYNIPLILVIILAIVFLPTVFSKDGESESDAIVTAIGVDKQDNDVQLSLQIIVPTPSSQYNQKLSLVTETAQDISSAINKISLRLGKNIGLAHCRVFVFSDELAQENITQTFDYIFRSKSNTQNIVLINTPDSAKDFLSNTQDLENNLYFSIRNRGSFNENYLYGNQTTLGMYYNDYLGPAKVSIISVVELVGESEASGEASGAGDSNSSGSNSGGADSSNESASDQNSAPSSSSQGGQDKKVIINRGKMLILKNGKQALNLSPEQGVMVNWFRKEATNGILVIPNVTEKDRFDNADIGIDIDKKYTRLKTSFKDGKPVFKLVLDLYVHAIEISQENYTLESYKSNSVNITPYLKSLIVKEITSQVEQGFKMCQDNNVDMINAYETFYKYNTRKFKRYLNTLSDKQNYIQNMSLEVEVNVTEHL